MSLDEPRRRDWWLVGCAVVAVALAASTTATVVDDERIAHATFIAPGAPDAIPAGDHVFAQTSAMRPAERPIARTLILAAQAR